ncbi:MAG: hypothetical protein VW802_06090 [Rhodospirillaceae bacterium]|jgi:hypothetical protein
MTEENRRSIHIDCLGIKLDYGNNAELASIVSNANELTDDQRYWLYHSICGCISIDTNYFLERFLSKRTKLSGNGHGSTTSLFPALFAAADFYGWP